MKKSQLRTIIKEELHKVLKEEVYKSEEEFFNDLQKMPNGSKAVMKMQQIDTSAIDTNDLLSTYQEILSKYGINLSLSNIKIDRVGNVHVQYQNSLKENDRDMSQVELIVTKLLKKANLNPTSVEVYKSSARPGATEALIKFPMAVDPLEVEEAYNDAVEVVRPGGGLIANDSWHKGSNNVVVLDLAVANKR